MCRMPESQPSLALPSGMHAYTATTGYNCGTRRYLAHAVEAPTAVEAYLERLRGAAPRVTWKVRCFHYEHREFWKGCWRAWRLWEGWRRANEGGGDAFAASPPSWMARKVVTHQAEGVYNIGRQEHAAVLASCRGHLNSLIHALASARSPFAR